MILSNNQRYPVQWWWSHIENEREAVRWPDLNNIVIHIPALALLSL